MRRRGHPLVAVAGAAFVLAMVAWTLFPVLWVLVTSLKQPADYFSDPPVWVPSHLTGSHYVDLFEVNRGGHYLTNSVIIGVSCTALTLLVAIPAAYVIGTSRTAGSERASFLVLSQRTLPPVVLLIPLFLLLNEANLLDTHIGLILAFATFNVPFGIWLLKGFFAEFPREVQEQALVDGLSEFGSVCRIVLPMIAPGLVVVALFAFLGAWNELMLSIAFTSGNSGTMTKLLSSLLQAPSGAEFGAAAATAVVSMAPAVALTLAGQRYLVRGLTAGSVR